VSLVRVESPNDAVTRLVLARPGMHNALVPERNLKTGQSKHKAVQP